MDCIKPSLNKLKAIYVEPFCGSFVVGMNLDLPIIRYAFDIDKGLITTWKVIRDNVQILQKTLLNDKRYKYNKDNFIYNYSFWQLCENVPQDYDKIEYAASYIFVNRTSRSANMKDFGTSNRLRGKRNEYLNAYENAITNLLPLNNSAIQNVIFDSGDYIELMEKYNLVNNNDVTCYIDPPYVHETRTSRDLYAYEFATYQKDVSLKGASGSHEQLLIMLAGCNLIAYLSGYESDAYRQFEQDYLVPQGKFLTPVFIKECSNNMSQLKTKSRRTEILWKI